MPATVSPTTDDRELSLRWSARVSLTTRILAVNILALVLLAGGFFYLDSYRSRLIDSRLGQAAREVKLIGAALTAAKPSTRDALVKRLATDTGTRIRLYVPDGDVTTDSMALGVRNFQLLDPTRQDWRQRAARFLDRAIDTVVDAERPPLYRERAATARWPDVVKASREGMSASVWRAPDRTPVLTAAAGLPGGDVVMTTVNARDITETVRLERFRLSLVLASVSALSVLLSLFLARTIALPLRRLARAAVRVRRGRAREVVVPRLPSRRDEIGMLARALSDMSLALRARIDATEAFAADVAHELKNPLASLRSAVDALERVADPALRAQLLGIVADDVRRLDRLITDIAEASRIDAQLSRAPFEPVDLAALVMQLVMQRRERGIARDVRLRFDHDPGQPETILGDAMRLERVFENVIENALSFSPDRGWVTIQMRREGVEVVIRIEDEGPGVPEAAREEIFERFRSVRPEGEGFGRHSGLGLAIARTIVEGHQGVITAESREDRIGGARFDIRLPAAGR